MSVKFPEQKRLISEALNHCGLSVAALAERVLVKPDTLRKIAGGHQKASARLLELIRREAAAVVSERHHRAPPPAPLIPAPKPAADTYRGDAVAALVDILARHRSAQDLTRMLNDVLNSPLAEDTRAHIARHIASLLQEKIVEHPAQQSHRRRKRSPHHQHVN